MALKISTRYSPAIGEGSVYTHMIVVGQLFDTYNNPVEPTKYIVEGFIKPQHQHRGHSSVFYLVDEWGHKDGSANNGGSLKVPLDLKPGVTYETKNGCEARVISQLTPNNFIVMFTKLAHISQIDFVDSDGNPSRLSNYYLPI